MVRPAGDGKPYKTKDGRWRAAVTVPAPDGGTKRVYLSGRTRTQVDSKRRELVRAREDGLDVITRKPRLDEWIDEWLTEILPAKGRAEKTIRGYRDVADNWILPAFGKKRLDEITPRDLDRLYLAIQAMGRSGSSQHAAHRVLSSALNTAVKRGIITTAVTTRTSPPPLKKRVPEVLTLDEAQRIATAALAGEGVRHYVRLSTGARQGEILGMAWPDVDWENASFHIERAMKNPAYRHGCDDIKTCTKDRHHTTHGCRKHADSCPRPCPPNCRRHAAQCPKRRDGGPRLGTVKTDAGDRTYPLSDQDLRILAIHREQQLAARKQDGDRWQPWTDPATGEVVDLVFAQRSGKPYNPRQDWSDWQRFLKELDIPPHRVHDARHTAATLHLVLGTDPRVVMQLMGWSQMSMLKTYQHVIPQMSRDATSRMAALLAGSDSALETRLHGEETVRG